MRPPRKRKRSTPRQKRSSGNPNGAIRRILDRISGLQFFTFSLVLHALIVVLVGGTVLYKVTATSSDFEAGEGGILTEDAANKNEPEETSVTERSEFQFNPPPPPVVAPLSVLTTSSLKFTTFKMAVLPAAPLPGISKSIKDKLASLGDRNGRSPSANMGLGGTAMGSTGGARSAVIFGRRIVASRPGVILDVSASGHSRLGGAVEEIQKGFSDATLIMYPGCGMMHFEGKPECEIRKFSSITPKELATNSGPFTTSEQLSDALKIETFQKMTVQPSVKETLFVAWYGELGRSNSYDKLIGQTQLAFEDLMKRGVDTIYWFSDFADPVDPRVIDSLGTQLQTRRIVLHVHNFAGGPINPEITDLVTKLGGTVNLEKIF